jgi:hypothetical protein
MATFWDAVPLSSLSPTVAEPVNYPNPFSKLTQIECMIPQSGAVKISVYDMMGRLMRVLHDGYLDAGKHVFSYDAGVAISSGKYLVVIKSGAETSSHWMTITK